MSVGSARDDQEDAAAVAGVDPSVSGGGSTTGLQPAAPETCIPVDALTAERLGIEAASILKNLATGMLQLVRELDAHTNIAAYVKSVTVLVVDEGNFQLQISDQNTGIDLPKLVAELSAACNAEHYKHGKPLRNIQLGDQNGGDHETGGDEPDARSDGLPSGAVSE